jgi:hypothetical protein
MPEKAISTANLELPKKVRQMMGMTIWTDWQTMKDLDLIAAYERKKRGPLMRDILVEKIRVYQRNPAFKRFLLQLREAKKHEEKEKDVKTDLC